MPPKTEAENITFLLQCLACATQNGGRLDYKALGALHNNATGNAIFLRLGRVKKSVNFTDPFAATGGETNTLTPPTAGSATAALLAKGAYAPTTASPPKTKSTTAPIAAVKKEKGYGVKRRRAADEEDLPLTSSITSTSPPPPPAAPPSSPTGTTANKDKAKAKEEEEAEDEKPTPAPQAATEPKAKRAKTGKGAGGAKKGQEMSEQAKKLYEAAVRAADLEVLGAGWVMGNGEVVKPYGEEEGEEVVGDGMGEGGLRLLS